MKTRLVSMLVCVFFAGFVYVLGRPLGFMLYTKWNFRGNKAISLVPQPLPENSSPAVGPKLNFVGLEFESPVPEVKVERKFESGVVLSFEDCVGVVIFKSSEPNFLVTPLRKANFGQNIDRLLGHDATSSDYGLRSKELNMTPSDLRVFSSPYAMAGNSVLLNLKSIDTKRFQNGLFHFETPWVRGFQLGDLARDKGVTVEAYDSQDRQIQLIIGRRPGKTCFSQADLNRIIFSLHPFSSN